MCKSGTCWVSYSSVDVRNISHVIPVVSCFSTSKLTEFSPVYGRFDQIIGLGTTLVTGPVLSSRRVENTHFRLISVLILERKPYSFRPNSSRIIYLIVGSALCTILFSRDILFIPINRIITDVDNTKDK